MTGHKTDVGTSQGGFSKRQGEVLAAALDELLEAGDRLTMASVAARAKCSKETLYKWFGDRDGLLSATVQWQAAKVKLPSFESGDLDRESLREGLADFALSWLEVLTGEISIALNGLAIAHAGTARSGLGQVVLRNGRFAIGARVKPAFEMARRAGLLTFTDSEVVFETFFGLVVRDVQIRALLGERPVPDKAALRLSAKRAAEQFLALYGAKDTPQT